MRNQKGFTLIEIIAVLVILGILAAVAIPKYFRMQTQAQIAAANGALGSAASGVSMAYAACLANGSYSPPTTAFAAGSFTMTGGTCPSAAGTTFGDFAVTYGGTATSITITLNGTGSPAWVSGNTNVTGLTKVVQIQ